MRALSILVVAFVACSKTTPETRPISPDPSTTASAATPAPTPPAPTPGPCVANKDCEWDDLCFAKACVPKTGKIMACEESVKPPGTCGCVLGKCTLRRDDPTTGAKKTGCTIADQCAFDPKTGGCDKGEGPRSIDEGGFCTCTAGTCTPGFVDRVACATSADCSWLEEPLRPVSSKKVPRPAGKPCAGYSRSAECRDGSCQIAVWKC